MAAILTHGTIAIANLKEAVKRFHRAGDQGLTREQLAKDVQLSLRGVDRILAQLRKDGALIDASAPPGQRSQVYRMLRPPRWDRRISGDTRLALRLAGLALSASGTRQWDGILEVLNSLADERMTEADRLVFQRMERSVRIQGEVDDPIEGEKVLEPLLRALEARQLVALDYRAAGWDSTTPIQVVPYTLVHDLFAGSAFLVAWDPNKDRVVHLRLNRIEAIALAGRGMLGPQALTLLEEAATYQVGGWTGQDGPFEVVVRIHGRYWVQALKDAPPPLPDYFHLMKGEALLAHFKATHTAGVLRWILQFGPDAEVLTPPELRAELAGKARAMAACYLS